MQRQPIKRSKFILPLSKDHHFTLLFCWKLRMGIRKGIETERLIHYINYFWKNHMQPHFYDEENLLFVGLNHSLILQALEDHKSIKAMIEEFENHTIENEQVAFLADIVEKHVRLEEREIFPYIEKTLTPEMLEEVGKQLHFSHTDAFKEDYRDVFWERS